MICACYRHTNKVVVIHSYQLYGVRLEGFHSWQRVFFLYLYPFVPDGAEKDCIEIPCLLCGDRGYTAALYPYRFRCGDFVVNACFAGNGVTLEECLQGILR